MKKSTLALFVTILTLSGCNIGSPLYDNTPPKKTSGSTSDYVPYEEPNTCSYDEDFDVRWPMFFDYCSNDERFVTCDKGMIRESYCDDSETCFVDDLGVGCTTDEDVSSRGNDCVSSGCEDDLILAHCENGYTVYERCRFGCTGSSCNSPQCTDHKCEGDYLRRCYQGFWDEYVECKYGCDRWACKPPECSESVCLNDNDIDMCIDGFIVERTCKFGCRDGECLDAQCDVDECLNSSILAQCDNGIISSVRCEYGCDNGACKPAECSTSTCKNDEMLNLCSNGHLSTTKCKYGCENGKCKDPQCSESVCLDADTLNDCVDGRIVETLCQFGCENDMCKDTECANSVCLDENTLNECIEGEITVTPCSFGCESGACKPAECTESVCLEDGTLQKCQDGHLVPQNCEFGCTNGTCNPPECEENTCAEDQKTLNTCNNGHIQKSECPFGCLNGACLDPECTETKCSNDSQTLLICNENKIEEQACDYKCSAQACVKDETARCIDDKHLLIRDASEQYRTLNCEYGCMFDQCINDKQSVCSNEQNGSIWEIWRTETGFASFECASNACENGNCNDGYRCAEDDMVCVNSHQAVGCKDHAMTTIDCARDEVCYHGACQPVSPQTNTCVSEKELLIVQDGVEIPFTCETQCDDGKCVLDESKCSENDDPNSTHCSGFDIINCNNEIKATCNAAMGQTCVETTTTNGDDNLTTASCTFECDAATFIAHSRVEYDAEQKTWMQYRYACEQSETQRGYVTRTEEISSPYGFKKLDTPVIPKEICESEASSMCSNEGFAIECPNVSEETNIAMAPVVTDCRAMNKSCKLSTEAGAKPICE